MAGNLNQINVFTTYDISIKHAYNLSEWNVKNYILAAFIFLIGITVEVDI